MAWKDVEVRELKEGHYIIIDDEPCKIVEFTTSKPGKHGEAKARIVAIGVFNNQKKNVVFPVKHKVKSPIIEKKNAQVLSVNENTAQLMDTSTYETFDLDIPDEFKGQIVAGSEIQYWEALGKRKIMKT